MKTNIIFILNRNTDLLLATFTLYSQERLDGNFKAPIFYHFTLKIQELQMPFQSQNNGNDN